MFAGALLRSTVSATVSCAARILSRASSTPSLAQAPLPNSIGWLWMKRKRSVSPVLDRHRHSSSLNSSRRPRAPSCGPAATANNRLSGRLASALSSASASEAASASSAAPPPSARAKHVAPAVAPPSFSTPTAPRDRRLSPEETRIYSKKTLQRVEQREQDRAAGKTSRMNRRGGGAAAGRTPASATGPNASVLAPSGSALTNNSAARGRGNAKPTGNTPKVKADTTPGPICDRAYIVSLWPRLGGKGQLSDKYLNNPKSIVSNYISSLGALPKYTTKKVVIEGKPLFRATIVADADPLPPPPVYGAPSLPQSVEPLVGTGDATNSKEAEKFAALHACVQLSARGLFTPSNQPLPDRLANSINYGAGAIMNGENAVAESSTGGATIAAATMAQNLAALKDGNAIELAGGQIINLEQAREFMDFYCQKFGFGKPDLQITRVVAKGANHKRAKNAAQEAWQATLLVQGSKIGVAEARNKKQASNRAYLDFARHLDSSDPTLWPMWQDKKRANVIAKGHVMAQVVFEADQDSAEDLEEVVYGARESGLYKRARAMIEHQQAKRAELRRQRRRNVEGRQGAETQTSEALSGSFEQDISCRA
ncbi:BQ5605_C022g09493 [Microbotryum silenes-dioicae]|uniref:BQ5605_C022g09493 protein n=1 Tax=Microbotryum silenes-dioicae TaxID=796604 RepID=A0A2X0N6X4_9BASI|nr:BQ5605_C022g09493 [Microbotryum silenes-dioicae]